MVNAQEVMNPDSSQKEYLNYLVTRSNRKLDEKEKAELNKLLEPYGIYIEEPIYGDICNYRTFRKQLEKCQNCKGGDNICTAKKLVYENWLRLRATECPLRRASRIIQNANTPCKFNTTRFTDFNFDKYNDKFMNSVADSINGNASLYLYGDVGTGKTMLSSIIINERARKNKRSHFYTVTDLVDDLRDFDDALKRSEKLAKIHSVPCLIIDDIGAEFATKWVATMLFDIIDNRYKNDRQIILTSNFDIDSLSQRYPDYHGGRISRRLKAMCTCFHMI